MLVRILNREGSEF